MGVCFLWFFVGIRLICFTNSYDFKDELIVKEAEKVLEIIQKCVSLGLKWKVSTLDLNNKTDYVENGSVGVHRIDCFKTIQIFVIFLI